MFVCGCGGVAMVTVMMVVAVGDSNGGDVGVLAVSVVTVLMVVVATRRPGMLLMVQLMT